MASNACSRANAGSSTFLWMAILNSALPTMPMSSRSVIFQSRFTFAGLYDLSMHGKMADKDRHETPRDPDASNRTQPAGPDAGDRNPSVLDGALFANHGRGGASGQRRHRAALDTRRCGDVSAILHDESPAGAELARAFRTCPADAGRAAD